jgi:hypothetical protein
MNVNAFEETNTVLPKYQILQMNVTAHIFLLFTITRLMSCKYCGCLTTKLSIGRFLRYDLLAATRKVGQEARWRLKDFILQVLTHCNLQAC